jgi:site-specific recombinase
MRNAMNLVLSLITGMMRSQLRLVTLVCGLFILGLFYATGLTIGNVVIAILLLATVGLFALLVTFWTAIFNSLRSQPPKRAADAD